MEGVANQTNFNSLVILPVFLSAVWIIWDLFYASFFLGFFVRTILNLFFKDTGIYIGQLSFNLIAGRIIFKDVEIYRKDDSIRITDGYGVLRWWKRQSTNEVEARCRRCSCQSSACANRKSSLIWLHLNGFEYHWYHRSDVYDAWGQPKINEPDADSITGDSWITSIQPTVHYTINKGRLVFGNQLVENNLVVQFDQAEGHYSLTRASNDYDEAMHLFKFHGDSIIASLTPTLGCKSDTASSMTSLEEFVVLRTDFVECIYSLDIPGLVPLDDTSSPKYAFDVKLGTNTTANYGTYVNRQRIILQNLFFPNDYTIKHVDRIPQPGEKRVYTSFDVSVFVSTPAKLDITFQGQSGLSHISFTVSGSSHLTVNQPWITKDDGYTTTVSGKLTDLEVFTSLPFEPLGRAESVNISTSLHFPRVWNSKQTWDMRFTTDQTQINILFAYVDFFNELLDDWIRNDTGDIIDFVPLDWNIGIDLSDYEIFLFTNRYNWIDIAPDGIENERLAFCGKTGHISAHLPFTEFLPNQQKILFSAHGQNIVVRHYFPPSSVFKENAFALSSANKFRWRTMEPPPESHHTLTRSVSQPINLQSKNFKTGHGAVEKTGFKRTHRRRGSEPLARVYSHSIGRMSEPLKEDFKFSSGNNELFPMGCRMSTLHQSGWLDLACGPSITIDIVYHNHNSDMTHLQHKKRMVPSHVIVDVTASSVLLRVFGFLARDLLALKENYPGEYMYFKTFSSQNCDPPESVVKETEVKEPVLPDLTDGPHEPDERFLDVIVHFKLQNITAEFPTHLLKGYPQDFPLPTGHSDSFSVLVEYRGNETVVQLNVDPVTIHLPSLGTPESSDHDLGVLALSGVSFNCHGFTEFMLKERVEYAWMMKLDIGKVTGSVTGEQLFAVGDFFQSIIGHIINPASAVYEAPDAILIEPAVEPLSELLKYKLFAFSLAAVDVNLRESNTILNIQTPGFDLDLCNLHNDVQTLAISLCLKSLFFSSYITSPNHSSMLLECANGDIGCIYGDIALREPQEADSERQQSFLRRADKSSHRLWFLWDSTLSCGCCGGCQFLDGSIYRNEISSSFQKSRYFSSRSSPLMTTDHGTIEPFPCSLSFDTLSSIECLHLIIVNYYGFIDPPVISSHTATTSYEGLAVETTGSLDSEATFDTAPTSLPTESEETYASLENSPQVSVKNSRTKQQTDKVPNTPVNATVHYTSVLDKYWCNSKCIKIIEKSPPHQLDDILLPPSSAQPSPWRTNKKGTTPRKHTPCFALKLPEVSHSSLGQLPTILSTVTHQPDISYKRFSHRYSSIEKNLDSVSSAFVSVNVHISGSIGVLLSPPAVDVLNKYISVANKYFTKRTAHSFLEGITFESFGKIDSQLSATLVSSASSNPPTTLPSNSNSPLVHLSVIQSPSSQCMVQMLNVSTVSSSPKIASSEKTHNSVLTVYASGVDCNAMIYHHNQSVDNIPTDNIDEASDNVQMTLRIAAELQLPVLQAGLFVLADSREPLAVIPPQTFLDFEMKLPSPIEKTHQIISIAEMSINKSSATVAAKIIQSELSSNPILTWSHVDTHLNKGVNYATPYFRNESEQSHNTIAISVNVPLVRFQIGAPCRGVPNSNDIGIDPAIIITFVKVWKPLIEDTLLVGMAVWRNKIVRDRSLLLSMLTSAMEKPIQNNILMPLLTDLSKQIRHSVAFSLINQLWAGLSFVTEDYASELPSIYKEGFLLQEIMAVSLALSLKLLHVSHHQSLSTPSPVQIRHTRSRHTSGSIGLPSSVVSYHSISPSPSDLGVPNVLFTGNTTTATITEYSEYQLLTQKASYNHFILLRESLLPVYKSSNIIIASQLKKHSYDSSKLNTEYKVQLSKATLSVVNELQEAQQPELIIEQLCTSGSLEYRFESRTISPKAVNYIVTVRQKRKDSQDTPQKLKSNIMSKCSVSLERLGFHITLPLLMVIRHTSESLHYMRQSLYDITNIPLLSEQHNTSTDNNDNNCTAWIRSQQLKDTLIEFENKHLPHEAISTVQSTPNSKRNLTIKTGDFIASSHESQSLSSVISEHVDSPLTDAIPGGHPIFSSDSHRADLIEDTTDSPQIFSSDPEAPIQSSMATYDSSKTAIKIGSIDDIDQQILPETAPNIKDILLTPDDQLEFSVYGSVRIACVHVSTRIESLLLILEVYGISGSVDCRKALVESSNTAPHYIPLVYTLLPTYLSIASTLRRTSVRVIDPIISPSDLAILSADNIKLSTSCCYMQENPAPAYRCLLLFPQVLLDVRQPPIVLHKKFHKYIPTFSAIYKEVFAPSENRTLIEDDLPNEKPTAPINVSDLQFPPHLPKGSALFFLKNFKMIVRPLSSLTVSYQVEPVTAQIETTNVVKLVLTVGEHHLEFNTKEYKDDLSLRPIPLPVILLKGNVVPNPFNRMPSVTLEIAVRQVVINVTTDVLNQLLIFQTAFIKEINELLNMFLNIGESLPQEKIAAINLKQPTDTGFEIMSLLNTIKLSMQGVKVTVSTPLATAVRFSTGNKIEMLITNPNHQLDVPNKSYLTLHGKVETEINIALGFISEESGLEEEDHFIELAYFKTWIAIKNTLQQNTPLGEAVDGPVSLDTFLISIYSPHLYIQSTAVEKAILFWVNCKSVYNFWQNEHKQLNAEVQAATEAFVGRLTKPNVPLKTPSIDFSKPRFVQITVSDVGACMPLIHLPTTPHSSQRGFPAVVLTIKEMHVSLNLSKKLASAGKFTGFLIRFDEQFHFRHKTWTIEPKKHKFLNYGVVPSGTYKLCVINKNNPTSPDDIEKILSAFTWHMSGININASTDIGHHISTLVHTLTTIGSDMEEPDTEVISPPVNSPIHVARMGHKRAQSFTSKSFVDDQAALRAMEWDLARQTRKLNKLKQTGAAPDSLKTEEDVFHKLEMDLVRGLRRVFRKGRGISLQQFGQIFSPRSSVLPSSNQVNKKRFGPSSTLPRKRLSSVDEEEARTSSSVHHVRHRSDISPDVLRLINLEEGSLEIVEEVSSESQDDDPIEQEKYTSKHHESLIPSVNIEINMTISVDSGSIVLHSEDLMSQEQLGTLPTKQFDSTQVFNRKDKAKSSIDTVILIPAVEIKTHYKSIVGQVHVPVPHASPYSTPGHHPTSHAEPHFTFNEPSDSDTTLMSHSSPRHHSSTLDPHDSISKELNYNSNLHSDLHVYDKSGNPVKKGVLIISAVIAPLPHDLELNPGLLDFVEQVVRPINISTQDNEVESDDDEEDDFMQELIGKETSPAKSRNSFNPLSFPVDVSITFTIHPSKIYLTCSPHAHVKCLIEIPTVNFAISFSLFVRKQSESLLLQTGLESPSHQSSIEDDIATFNNLHVTGCFKTFALVMFTPPVQSTTATGTTKQDKKDKEAFNLVLGQAYIHLSRKSVYGSLSPHHSLNDSITHEKLQVSVIPVVESLLLTYDWRRLNDITLFRKCWYHTGLVEALFTGSKPKDDSHTSSSPGHNNDSSYTSPSHSEESSKEQSSVAEPSDDSITAEIAVAVSVVDLRLYANVAQFMGNAHVILSHLQGLCHTDIQNNELMLLVCDGEIEDMEVDAEGGVVAGNLIIKSTRLHILTSHYDKVLPEHKATVITNTVQGHIDYMSAHIMLLRVVGLTVEMWDVWKGISLDGDQHASPSIEICALLKWDTFQLAIHRSTAKAMFGIAQKMYDFVMLQKKRSERTIGLMLPAGTAASTAFAAYQEDQKRAEKTRAADVENPLLEYHHWIWAVKVGSEELLKSAGITNYDDHNNISLGGSIEIFGNNICLVCFHGTSFRETEWAAFNIDLVGATFTTVAIPGLGELRETIDDKITTRICNQKCQFHLGDSGSKVTELAAVYRVSSGRGGVPPISQKEIADWLNYACIDHYIHRDALTTTRPLLFIKQSQKLNIQQIIGIPAFEVTLTNDHFWPSLNFLLNHELSSLSECAKIECSLSSNFHGDISVTTTVENYLFLHDLFSAYVDHLNKQQMSFRPPFASVSSVKKESITLRHFVSIHWELDPHLLLIGKATWASGQFNPHINWLLERLGFDHARTTIPEYVQRGLMDPLDLAIASLLEVLITLSGSKKVD